MNWKQWFKPQNTLTPQEIMLIEIEEFNQSQKRKWMLTGKRYYDVENDINSRVMTRYEDDLLVTDDSKANNKIAHAFMKNIVDEKVGYLLGKEFTYMTEDVENDTGYIEKFKKVLGKNFQYELSNAAIEASNKGIAFWQVYIDEQGQFKYLQIPSEQCIPIWSDSTHTTMDAMIRHYVQWEYDGKEKKEVTKVEYHTAHTSEYFVLQDSKLIYDVDAKEEAEPVAHYYKGGEGKSWGRVPFVAFKNNRSEFPDIKFVKSLIDDYDIRRSDISNILDECLNYIYVIKNYGGQDLGQFVNDINFHRAIEVDDDGGVTTLTPQINVDAAKMHLEQTKKDISMFAQSVNMDQDKFGASPSGIALKFLYSGLDLKCNNLENEFKRAFDDLQYFVDVFLAETGQGDYSNIDIDVIFNRDIAINETDSIDNCGKSKGVISDRTIVANHPWVTDLEEEMGQIEKEQSGSLDLDLVPDLSEEEIEVGEVDAE